MLALHIYICIHLYRKKYLKTNYNEINAQLKIINPFPFKHEHIFVPKIIA